MTISQVIAFSDFYETISSQKLNITTAYKINKILKSFSEDIIFYQTELRKIFDECVEQENGQYKMTEDQQNFVLKQDKIEEFETKFNELRNIEVEFDENDRIEVGKLSEINITPAQLLQIQDFIK